MKVYGECQECRNYSSSTTFGAFANPFESKLHEPSPPEYERTSTYYTNIKTFIRAEKVKTVPGLQVDSPESALAANSL